MQVRKSDNAAEIGRHVWELAGLGLAPFRCVGFLTTKRIPAPGVVLPGASCQYCGQGIMYACKILSADGKKFLVGCDCVQRTGDLGVIKAYKKSPEYRAHQRELRMAKDERVREEWQAILADPAKRAVLEAEQIPTWDGKGMRPWLAYAEKSWAWSGASGRNGLLKRAKKMIAEAEAK